MRHSVAWGERWRVWWNRKPDPETLRSIELALPSVRRKTIAIQLSSRHVKTDQVEVLESLRTSGALTALLRATSSFAAEGTRHLEELHAGPRRNLLKWNWEGFRATAYAKEMAPVGRGEFALPCCAYVDSVSISDDKREIELLLDFKKCVVRIAVVLIENDRAVSGDAVVLEGLTPLLSSFYIMENFAGEDDGEILSSLFEQSR